MIKLIDADGRTNAFLDNQLIGYWDHESDYLYGIDRRGLASVIVCVDHRNEIIPALTEWRNKQ